MGRHEQQMSLLLKIAHTFHHFHNTYIPLPSNLANILYGEIIYSTEEYLNHLFQICKKIRLIIN